MINKSSQFYTTAKRMLEDYVAKGGKIQDLGRKDKEYRYIKNTKVKDENGNNIDLETKFSLLGYPRKAKNKDSRQQLIDEATAYKQEGKSFHITRKKLPFYPILHTYSKRLKGQGFEISYEQIMKELGFKDYSDTYFRCLGLFELSKYRDEDGFVDNYRKNKKLKAYISSLGESLNLPYYLVITLIADENLKECYMETEYINQVKIELQEYFKKNGSFKGLSQKDQRLYYKFNNLMNYYGDGEEVVLTAEDWLNIFDLSGVENRFREASAQEIDIEPLMIKFKERFGNEVISAKDIDRKEYRVIIKKAIKLAIPVKELFRNYGLNYIGNVVDRLSLMKMSEIPYLKEMRELRDELLNKNKINKENGYCKEEIFEAKVEIVKQVYDKFKDKIFNFEVSETQNVEDATSL